MLISLGRRKGFYKILPLFLLFFLMVFQLMQIVEAQSSLFAYNTVWCPNPSWNGGLNTEITFSRFFRFSSVFLQNQTFYATYNGTTYYLNVTSGSNVQITLHNWFDSLGTVFSVDRACEITLFVGGKGDASKVNGASYVYHVSNQTIDLTISGASYVGVHWGSGGSVRLNTIDQVWTHSWGNYKTAYGFGIVRGGYWQYAFNTRIYAQNGRDDIQTITLELERNVTLTYTEGSQRIEENDPYDLVQVADEWFREEHPSSWVSYNEDSQYLDVGFNIRFLQVSSNESIPAYWFMRYTPRMQNQNATVTVGSSIEGTIINEQPAIFYIGVSELPFLQPVEIAWNLSYLFIGFGAMFLLIFAPFYGVYKIKKGEIPEGIGWGIVIFIIGIGLLVVWLWR